MVDPLAPRVDVPKGHVKQRELVRGLLAGENELTVQSWQVPAGVLLPFLPPPLVWAGSGAEDSPVSLRPRGGDGGETVPPAVDKPLPAPHKQAPSDSTRPFLQATQAPLRHDEQPWMLEQVERLVRMVAGAAEGEGALLLLLLLLFWARALLLEATSSKSTTRRHVAVVGVAIVKITLRPPRRRPPRCGGGRGGVAMMMLAR